MIKDPRLSHPGKENGMYGKIPWNKGEKGLFHHSTKSKILMCGRSGTLSGKWKGDNVSYTTLHQWLRRHKPIPEKCEMCNKNAPYDLANITGIYNRDFDNWKYLCRRCHVMDDGRINHLTRGECQRDPKTGRFI